MALPLIPIAVATAIPEATIFLTGESGVGKDTIFNILKDGKFVKDLHSTTILEYQSFITCGKRLCVINTAGASDNDEENAEARRELKTDTRYAYVFRADDYLTNAKVKKQVDLDLDVHKELCEKKKCILKIIGTHKDKCLERGISKDEIRKLEAWLGEKGKFQCQILDLTQFNGEEKQQELCDFITD